MAVPARLHSILGALLSVLALHLTSAHGDIIYDNTGPGDPTGVWDFQGNYTEFGDEIILLGGTNSILTQFQFEYFGAFKATGNETAEVHLYRNDGPKTADGIPTPGTVLYDSGPFSIFPDYEFWTSSALNIPVPGDLTWTVKFSGLTGTNKVGILFRDPPQVGKSYNDAWLEVGNVWETVTFSSVANFSARLESTPLRVSVQRDGPQVVVAWTGLSILQEADDPAGPYQDRPEYRNVYRFTTSTAPHKYWRLRD